MSTDVLKVDFCISAIERTNGVHNIIRYFTDTYYRANGIVTFDADGERKHFLQSDIVSITPRIYGTFNGEKISRTYPMFNIENNLCYTQSDEEYQEILTAAEEEAEYGY